MRCKICGVSDFDTLNYITEHPFKPDMIGFIVNYPKSKRYIDVEKLKRLIKIDKKKSFYVAVLVNPKKDILEKIKDLPFDYYQLYNCSNEKVKNIKDVYNKKIIVAMTVENSEDVNNFELYKNEADIYLFDSKGYEKSKSFNHSLIENIKFDKDVMLAGNIQINDDLEKYKKIVDIIDISGGLETSGLKDINKIETFLNKLNDLNNEA